MIIITQNHTELLNWDHVVKISIEKFGNEEDRWGIFAYHDVAVERSYSEMTVYGPNDYTLMRTGYTVLGAYKTDERCLDILKTLQQLLDTDRTYIMPVI